MKWTRKITSVVLVIILLFTNTSISVYASDNNSDVDSTLYIYSKECPIEYVKYAKDNIKQYFVVVNLFDEKINTIEVGIYAHESVLNYNWTK